MKMQTIGNALALTAGLSLPACVLDKNGTGPSDQELLQDIEKDPQIYYGDIRSGVQASCVEAIRGALHACSSNVLSNLKTCDDYREDASLRKQLSVQESKCRTARTDVENAENCGVKLTGLACSGSGCRIIDRVEDNYRGYHKALIKSDPHLPSRYCD